MQYLGMVMQSGTRNTFHQSEASPCVVCTTTQQVDGELWMVKLESGLISKQFSPLQVTFPPWLANCRSTSFLGISLTYMSVTQKGKYFQALKVTGNFVNQDKAHIQIFLHSKMGCGWFWEFSAFCQFLYSTSAAGCLCSKKLRVPTIHLMRTKWKNEK